MQTSHFNSCKVSESSRDPHRRTPSNKRVRSMVSAKVKKNLGIVLIFSMMLNMSTSHSLLSLPSSFASGSFLLCTFPLAVLGTRSMNDIPPASHLCLEQRS
jgi:hypothetical protein